MNTTLLLVAFVGALIALMGCNRRKIEPTNLAKVSLVSSDDISIKDIPGDPPEFKREYVAQINQDVSMKVTIHTGFGGSTYAGGELDQGNAWVLFDPEKPADKILDRAILPIVEKKCRTILATDKQFRDSGPKEFTDSSGHVWVLRP